VVLPGLEENAIARPHNLDGSAAALCEAYARGAVDGLSVEVGVLGGASDRDEVDARGS
jgi:hypothetical protein